MSHVPDPHLRRLTLAALLQDKARIGESGELKTNFVDFIVTKSSRTSTPPGAKPSMVQMAIE